EVPALRHSGQIIADTLEVLQCAVLHPHLSAPCSHLLVFGDFSFGYRYDETIDVCHECLLRSDRVIHGSKEEQGKRIEPWSQDPTRRLTAEQRLTWVNVLYPVVAGETHAAVQRASFAGFGRNGGNTHPYVVCALVGEPCYSTRCHTFRHVQTGR